MLAYNSNWTILWRCFPPNLATTPVPRLPHLAVSGGPGLSLLVPLLAGLLGLPLLLLEATVGQLTRSGPVRALERMVTLGQGLGLAMSLLSWATSLYSLVPLAWALKLLVASANSPLLWLDCRCHTLGINTT
jgi:SNF family Na+-dependent transporter